MSTWTDGPSLLDPLKMPGAVRRVQKELEVRGALPTGMWQMLCDTVGNKLWRSEDEMRDIWAVLKSGSVVENGLVMRVLVARSRPVDEAYWQTVMDAAEEKSGSMIKHLWDRRTKAQKKAWQAAPMAVVSRIIASSSKEVRLLGLEIAQERHAAQSGVVPLEMAEKWDQEERWGDEEVAYWEPKPVSPDRVTILTELGDPEEEKLADTRPPGGSFISSLWRKVKR